MSYLGCGCYNPRRRPIPCPCQEDLSAFLAGQNFPLLPPGIALAFSTPSGGHLAPLPLQAPISDPAGLVDFLNTTFTNYLLTHGHTVQGNFSIYGGQLRVPQVDGVCLLVSLVAPR